MSSNSFAQPTDFTARYDQRTLGDLVEDQGQNVPTPELWSDPNLIVALQDAAGEIVAACISNNHYTTAVLFQLAGSGMPSGNLLIKLNCAIALTNLVGRRFYNQDEVERRIPDIKWARETVTKLKNGEMVFELPTANVTYAGVTQTTPLGANVVLAGHNPRLYGRTIVNGGPNGRFIPYG